MALCAAGTNERVTVTVLSHDSAEMVSHRVLKQRRLSRLSQVWFLVKINHMCAPVTGLLPARLSVSLA
jgi:hypothetical protein